MRRLIVITLSSLATVLAVTPSRMLAQAPAAAPVQKVELVGSWTMINDEERLIRIDPGPELGNFTGFPLNPAGRLKALTWNSTIQAIPEHQGRPHAGSYSMRGPNPSPHIGEIIDPVSRQLVGYTLTGLFENANRTIWLDGRPHPSDYAERLWTGFSTGEWEDGMLHVTTTHFKPMFQQRNGIPVSPYAVMHEFYMRHGDRLTTITQIDDPVYLEEPMIRTSTFRSNAGAREGAITDVDVADEVPGLKQGDVPHYPLGARHPEYADDNKLPFEATLAGRETLYPEYVEKLKQMGQTTACAACNTAGFVAPQLPPAPKGRSAKDLARPYRPTYESKGEVEVLPVQGSVYLLAGAASNVAVAVGPREVFVVDTAEAAMSDKLLAAIKTISPLPIRYIVNTSADADHVGGNEKFAKSAGGDVNAFYGQGARVFSSERAYARMTDSRNGNAPLPSALWPTDSFEGALKTLFVGEPIEIHHPAAAHTDGDLMVFFRKSDVIAAGDVFATDRYPVIDAKRGGSLAGALDGLNQLIDLAIPEFNEMGGTRVIPGHGRISNEIDLVEYRDAVTIIADRITQLILDGKTLDQVKAAGVSIDYDGLYGATSGEWTTNMFIEAAYREIKANTAPWKARLLRNVPQSDLDAVATNRPATDARKLASAKAAAPAKRASDPWEGKWVLDLFSSNYEPVSLMPYRREMVIAMSGNETTHEVSSWRRPQGNGSPLSTYSYKATLDGKECPIPNWGNATVTLKRVDANTLERTLNGQEVGKETATWTLSADRKKLTVVAKGTDPTGIAYTTTQVYEKQ